MWTRWQWAAPGVTGVKGTRSRRGKWRKVLKGTPTDRVLEPRQRMREELFWLLSSSTLAFLVATSYWVAQSQQEASHQCSTEVSLVQRGIRKIENRPSTRSIHNRVGVVNFFLFKKSFLLYPFWPLVFCIHSSALRT